jgi:hypothetical protein
MRAFLAIFLVMLIGNPVCCCAFARMHGDCEVEAARLPTCCQARRDGSPEKEVPPAESCPCAKKVGIVATDKVFPPSIVPLKWIPAIPVRTDYAGLDRHESGFRSGTSSPPAFLTVGSPPPRLLYGVFRC